jgi:type IV secretory pathway VirB2 component (pilin)
MSAEGELKTGRLARTLALIAFVTATFLLVAANRLDGELLQVGAVAIGAVAFLTASTAFLIAAGEYYEGTEREQPQG